MVALDPIEIPSLAPELEEEAPGNALLDRLRGGGGDLPAYDDEPEPPRLPVTPAERRQDRTMARQQEEATALGDAYRGMSDEEVARREALARPGTPGSNSRIYPPGVIPPPTSRLAPPVPPAAPQPASLDEMLRAQPADPGLDPGGPASQLSDPSAPPPQQRPAGAAGPSPTPPAAPARDMTGTDVRDFFARLVHGLGSGLSVAAGGASQPFQSERARIEARDQRALEQGREDEDRAARREAVAQQLRDRATGRESQESMQRESLALRRQGLEQSAASDAARLEQQREMQTADPRRQVILDQIRTREALRDAGSAESAAIRQQLTDARARARRHPVLGRLYDANPPPEDWTGERAAVELRQLSAQLERMGVRGSAGGGGGSRAPGGVPRSAWGTDQDPLVQEAMRMGVPPVSARQMAVEPRTRRQLEQDLAGAGVVDRRRGEERSAAAATPTREQSDRAIALSAAEDAVQQAIEALPAEGEDIPGVGRLDSLRGGGFWQSAAGQRMRTLAANAVRRYLRLESGAAISDQEMESEMELRGMGTGATETRFRQGLADLERDLQRRAATLRGGLAAPIERGAEPARSPGPNRSAPAVPTRQQANPAPTGDRVRVRMPDGQVGSVPRANLARALERGAVEL